MTCFYIYKGHRFNSELALDDFLLEKEDLVNKYGDIVFSIGENQLHSYDVLLKITEESQEAIKARDEWRKSNKNKIINEDNEEVIDLPPFLGVNKFLSQVKVDGKRLSPEFIDEEYWSRRFKSWENGEYTDTELEVFELDPNNSPKITNKETLELMKEKMKFRWESQAKSGTAIHNVLLLYFSKMKREDGTEINVYELENPKDYIMDHLEEENIPYTHAVDDILKYAKSLKDQLLNKFGNDALFFPEFVISRDAVHPDTGNVSKLIGIADLIIIDSNGTAHILDYKTSIKTSHSTAKRLSYDYQLATYKRILDLYGLKVSENKMLIAPLTIEGFKLGEDGKYTYEGVRNDVLYEEINTYIDENKWSKIDEFLPMPFKISLRGRELLQRVETIMNKWFPHYSSDRLADEKSVIRMLKARGDLKKNDKGEFVYKTSGMSEGPIVSTDEGEFILKVLEYEKSLPKKRERATEAVIEALKEAIKNNSSDVNWPQASQKRTGLSATWLKDTLAPYCNSNTWEIQDSETLKKFGIIILKNKVTNHVDFLRISTNILDENYREYLDKKENPFADRLGLTGTFEADVVEQSKSRSLMLEGVKGNIELMELMAILNCYDGLEGLKIGNMKILNPYQYKSIAASNEELLYCFNALNKHADMGFNQFDNGTIKLASKYELAYYKFMDIMAEGEANEWKDSYYGFLSFQSCTIAPDENIESPLTIEFKILKLNELLEKLKSNNQFAASLERVHTDVKDLNLNHIALQNLILTAISDLRGINFRQLLADHSKWLEAIFKNKGVSGTYTDNPGNLNSETLNLITKLVTEAYLNTRDEMSIYKPKIQLLVQKLKESKGFNYAKENIGVNLAALYKNLFVEKDGDLLFLRLDSVVDPAERELLEYALDAINKDRFPDLPENIIAEKKRNWDIEYYRVPLCKGSSDSLVSSRGLLSMMREKLSHFLPKKAWKIAREKLEGIYEAEDTNEREEVLFRMTNLFNKGEETTENRLRAIKSVGIENLERNIETLVLKHQFAYAQLRNVNQVFPLIKASMVHLTEQGAMLNKVLEDDISYLKDYIKNKILNKSIVNPSMKNFNHWANMVKRAASVMTLAFSPVQAIYQPLQGLWQDIRLYFSRPGGSEAFTFNNFKKALSLVYGDLFNLSGNPTIFSLLNEIYGINDMDMNMYIDRITKNKKGIWNFENMLFKFASRPDYYNRLTIFTSLMLQDGCFEAHTIEDGRLKYDWTKDKRFSKFAADPKSTDPEVIKLKTLYYAIALQFVAEHAKNFDGTEFKLDMNDPMALPRAYTNKLAESMKSLGDDIYGYYSHEKKSLIMATTIGSLWLQFKTYWSGKKNQYLQPGKVRLKGDWQQYSENVTETDAEGNLVEKEVKYYYQVDADGNILFDQPPTTEETIAPVMQWKGQWQEGILVTMGDIFAKSFKDPMHIMNHFSEKWNAKDTNLRNCYRSNMKALGYDLTMWLIVGSILGALLAGWSNDLKKDNKKHHNFAEGVTATAANVLTMSVKNSFLDLNFIESVGSPIGQWTPFAFEWVGNQYNNLSKVVTGEEDIYDGLIKISSTTRAIKPMFDSIKPDMFRTKSEGGTWESATVKKNKEKNKG